MRTMLILLALTIAAAAQQPQQLDPELIKKLIPALEQQRNDAQNRAALMEARAAQLTDELQKAKADLAKTKDSKPQE